MYGQIFEDNTFTSAEAGINDCKFVSYGHNPNGGAGGSAKDVIDLVLKVGGLEVKTRWFEQTLGNCRKRTIKDALTGKEREQTDEEAFEDAIKEQQWITKHILTALGVPSTAFADAIKKVKSFKDYAQMLSSLVPRDATEKHLECILQYDQNGYLKMPNKLWVTGKVLRDKDSNQPPLKLHDRLKLTKEGSEEDTSTDEGASINWEA